MHHFASTRLHLCVAARSEASVVYRARSIAVLPRQALCCPSARRPRLCVTAALREDDERAARQQPAPPSPPPDTSPQPPQQQPPPAPPIVATAAVGYSLATAAGLMLGGPEAIEQLQQPWGQQAVGSLPYLGLMMASLAFTMLAADALPPLQQMKRLYTKRLIPMLQPVPLWGLAVVALGAGIGEEAVFRGWAQPAAIAALAPALAPAATAAAAAGSVASLPDPATALGIGLTSVVFGALHALTPAYAIWACAASILLGVEAMKVGLPAAMLTHAAYDLIALMVVLQQWGRPVWLPGSGRPGGEGKSGSDDGV